MSAYSSVLGVAVLLLHLWGTHSFPTSACPVPCLCQRGPLLNCSSLGLTTTPTHIPANVVSLNLSNNALRSLAPLSFGHVKLMGLLYFWVGSNALESLSLILEEDPSATRTLSSREQECTSWASELQLLSAERNQLKHLPKGLGCMKSLQILQLSYNQISNIGLTDLDNCSYLKELHLKHNSITSIHPNAFKDLKQLQVLDLSYNLLVTIPIPAYQSLRSLNALVDVSFNRWKCDCNLQTLRRWISFDTEMGDVSWQVVCASPPHHAGKDLLHLKDSELTCPTHEYSTSGRYHDMNVYEGTKMSIPCSNDSKDIMQVHWWTPQGQVTDNQPELLIKDITEQHAGLYVCISGVRGEHISVFDLHVYKKGSGSRARREAAIILDEQGNLNLPRNDPVVRQGTKTQSEFVLAVCLSVIITFILAFILGVFLRPLLDKLWRRIRSKRQSSPPPTTTISSTGPQPYVNEGYCDVENQEQEVRVGSRVTFGGITVEDQVPYYVTVEADQADGSSESNTEAYALYETVEKKKSSKTSGKQQALEVENHRGRADSSSSSSLQEGEVNAVVINGKKLPPRSTEDMPKSMEFEQIPDANEMPQLKRRDSSSASSQSSQEDNFSRELRESSVDPPPDTIPANKNTEQNVEDLDPELWNDSGESFSFNEGSERSSIRDISSSALGHPLKDDDTWRQGKVQSPSDKKIDSDDFDRTFGKDVLVDDVKQFDLSDITSLSNSSDSGESVGGPNNYIVNRELEESDILEESDTENGANLVTLNRFDTFEDVTFNERMPSAGILIRQETITLEPSDIHLTFTHGNSIDEDMLMDDSQGNMYVNISKKFAICADVGLDTVPKVKRYVEFKQSKPHFGHPTLPTLSEMEVKSEANIDPSSGENRCLSHIKVSPETIQKVKRYIHFKHPEPHSPTLPTSPSLTKKDAMLEDKSYSSSSEDDAQLTTKDDNFFRTIGVSSEEVSKVKRYISFKQFDSSSPTLSISRPSTNIETTTEAIKSTQPSTSTKDSSQNMKKYMFVKQHEHPSSSLPSSPTSSRKGLSGKKTKYKKRNDQSYYGSHESLPLYHVHPVYRSSINRLNRGYDTDRSLSSEDEDQFIEYPRKLEITISPEMNTGSIKPDKNTDKILNIGFDNSSSSTDVFEKKHSKGLMRLRALSARLFNRHENETNESRSPTGLDVGRTSVVSIKKQSKLTKEQTANEDSLFGRSLSLDHLPKVKRYLQFSHSDSFLQVQLPSPPPTTGVVTPEFIATTESRRSSFSSEDDVKQAIEDKKFVGEVDASYEGLPKVKRYIQFSHTEPYSTTLPLNKESISTELVPQPEPRRPSTSSEDDIKPTSNEDSFFRKIGISLNTVPRVKRCIQFTHPESQSPEQTTRGLLSERVNVSVVAKETRRWSTSSEEDVKPSTKEDNIIGETGVYLAEIPKVKRYIKFTQSQPYSSDLSPFPPSTVKSTKVTETEYRETTSSEDDFQEDNGFGQIGASLDRVPRVKRYIEFTHPESKFPAQTTALSAERANVSVVAKEPRSSTSSEENVKPSTNKDNIIEEKSEYLAQIPKIKRYIKFTQAEQYSLDPSQFPPSSTVKTKVTETELRKPATRESTSFKDDVQEVAQVGVSLDRVPKVKRYIQFTHPESQSLALSTSAVSAERVGISGVDQETWRSIASSEEDVTLTAKEDNVFGHIGASLDKLPKVKRYIQFTTPESEPLVQTTTAHLSERVSEGFQETRSSTSAKVDVKPSTHDNNAIVEIPKVKRYIEFTQSEPSQGLAPFPSSTAKSIKVTETESRGSSTLVEDNARPSPKENIKEDNAFGQTEAHLDRVPRVKRYIQFTHQSPEQAKTALSAKRVGISEVISETRSISSVDDDTLSAKEDYFGGHIGAPLDTIPKVKRYISFTHPESQSPVQTTTALSAERVSVSVIAKETRRPSTSSEDDVKPSTNDDNIIGGKILDNIPKVKRYIEFTQYEPYSSAQSQLPSSNVVKSIKVTATELRGSSTSAEDNVQTATNGNKTKSMTLSTSSDNLDRIPRVKRYIDFSPAESQYPARSSTAVLTERDGISRISSTSSKSIKPSSTDYNIIGETDKSFASIPKVKKYIQFTQSEPHSSTLSSFLSSNTVKPINIGDVQEKKKYRTSYDERRNDNFFQEIGVSLDKIPKVKRYVTFTKSEPTSSTKLVKRDATPTPNADLEITWPGLSSKGSLPDSMKKGSALIIKTESESRLSGFTFKDNVMTKESMGSSVQTGLRSSLSSVSSDKQSVGHQVMDEHPPQDEPPAVPLTSPPPLEPKDAREYLRENSEVLQRQERRRLLQQRRSEMKKFNIASLSSMQQDSDQQDISPRDYGGAAQLQTEPTYSNISTRNTAASGQTEGAEAPVLRGLKTKNISTPKYKEFLI